LPPEIEKAKFKMPKAPNPPRNNRFDQQNTLPDDLSARRRHQGQQPSFPRIFMYNQKLSY
jgi:hypothetical protein